jgi:hypothetical protein
MTEAAQINDFANGLAGKIWAASSDGEVVAICQKYEKQVLRLKDMNSVRYQHIVNVVKLKRKDFRRCP